jgi:NADPH:quinone reductase
MATTRAIRFHEAGGPDVLRLEEVEVGPPGPGEAQVRQRAVGVNFVDTYHRSGLYPMPLPSGLGVEAAGVVEAVGAGVTGVRPGDRVAYTGGTPGSYAGLRNYPADRLVKVPDAIDDQSAAAVMTRGLTVWMLARRIFPVKAGDTVLLHAATGGVGILAVQWLKQLGATVIGTVGNDEKAAIARAHGCDHVIVYSREPVAARVREITKGEGVAVVYDGVGKSTFEGSLDSLRPLGMMVSYGNASGAPPPLDVLTLSKKGSLFLTRPTVFHYISKRDDLERAARELFDVIASGAVKVEVSHTWPLEEAAMAHRALESRATTGSVVLLP